MAIDSCTLVTTQNRSNRDGLEVVAIYRIKSDTRIPSYKAELDARGASPNPIPSINESFLDTIGPTGSQETFRIDDIFADDIQTRPVGGSEKIFISRVIYRNPSHPSSVSGRRSSGSPPDKHKPPEERKPEVFTRTLVVSKPRDFGTNAREIRYPFLDDSTEDRAPAIRKAGTFGPITNAAGFRYGSVETLQVRLPVFVFRKAVKNPFSDITIHRDFANKTNNANWLIFGTQGTRILPNRAMCWYVEGSDPLYHGNELYYEVECAVIYDPQGHFLKVRNEGDKAWIRKDTITDTVWRIDQPTRAGFPLQPPFPLDGQGRVKENLSDPVDILIYSDLPNTDLTKLTDRLRNLT
jgi:hypothetical protein